MTRTEVDLRAVFADRAEHAPAADAVLAHLRTDPHDTRRGPRLSTVLVAAVAVAVVVAVTAVGAAWLRGGVDRQTTVFNGALSSNSLDRTDPALTTWSFQLRPPPPGYVVESTDTYPDRQVITYSSTRAGAAIAGVPDVIEAVVYRSGAFDPTTVRTGIPLTVQRRPGFFGPAAAHTRAADGEERTALVPSIAWTYATDAWVVVSGVTTSYQQRTVETAIAATVHALNGHGVAVRIPFRVGYLPAGLHAAHIRRDADSSYLTQVDFGSGGRTSVVSIAATYTPTQSVRAAFGTDHAPLTVDGNPAALVTLREGATTQGHQLVVIRDGFFVMIDGDTTVSTAELRAIDHRLTFTRDGAHPTRWLPAARALPNVR